MEHKLGDIRNMFSLLYSLELGHGSLPDFIAGMKLKLSLLTSN